MEWFNILMARLRALFRRESVLRDIEEELRIHVEMETETNIKRGMPPEEARAAAMKSFGAMGRNTERGYDIRGAGWLETLWQDMRYGTRTLLKNPGFTLIAVLTLALGIGANTAIFSLVQAVILRPLPFPEAGRLAQVWNANLERDINHFAIKVRDYEEWRKQSQVFEQLAAYKWWTFTLTGSGEPEQIPGNWVTASFFSTLGVGPLLGRSFLPEEEQPGGPNVVILSYGLWQRRFGGDRNLLNQTITLDSKAFTVVGIMPAGFEFPLQAAKRELWTPLIFQPAELQRGGNNLNVVGRLKPGFKLQQAQTELDALANRLESTQAPSNARFSVRVVSLAEEIAGDAKLVLLVLLGAVGCVLLIGCANVTNLRLARAAARHKEIAIRRALGASSRRLLAQLLTEGMLLSLLAGTLGLLLAWSGLGLLVSLSPIDLTRVEQVRIDSWVLAFTLLVSLLTGLLFSLAPAWQATRGDVNVALKDDDARQATASRAGRRIRQALVVSEVALALALLVGAGLLLQSFARLYRVDSGLNTQNVLTASIALSSSQYRGLPQQIAFARALLERLRALPEAQAAGLTSDLPLRGGAITESFTIEGRSAVSPNTEHDAGWYTVSSGYFSALGMPLLRGRDFTEQDAETAPRVVVINQAMAQRFWPGEEAVGQRLKIANEQSREVIGVVGDTKHLGLDKETMPEMYVPYAQTRYLMSLQLVVRTTAEPLRLADAVRKQALAVNPNQPVAKIKTMDQYLSEAVAPPRFRSILLGLFGLLALGLAAGGLYGMMSYTVTQRTREIGIRMALGAQARDVHKLVLQQGLNLTLLGVLIGLGGALAFTRLLKNFLFQVGATDPLTFVLIPILLVIVALLACWIPARRATKVDPLIALRCE